MGHSGRAVAVALVGLALAGCGSGGTGANYAGPAPSRPGSGGEAPTDTTVTPAAGAEPGSAGGGGSAGTSGGGTTQVALYFTRGERVVRVSRTVPKVTRIGAEAVRSLLGGPNAEERRAGLATAIPAGTEFRDLVIQDSTARVDLSGTFESGGGGLALTLRLAQVACTLDAFPTVTGVRFALDGKVVDVLSGDGVVVDRPVSCDSYREYLEGAPPAPEGTFPGIWPFASAAEVEAYARGRDTTFLDPAATASEFAKRYLGFTQPVTFRMRVNGGQAEVPVGFGTGEGGAVIPDPRPTTVVRLQQLAGEGEGAPWSVVGAASDQIVVDDPASQSTVSSPLPVAGRATAFEGTVNVEVREDGMVFGQALGKGFVTGRGDGVLGPFSGQISFRRPAKAAGAVVFFEMSMADGSTLRATVVRVGF
jgi:hypothetical protein